MVKGWTKMDEGSWRHDKLDTYNKLNIYVLENPDANYVRDREGKHISDMRKNERSPHGYIIIYSDNGMMGKGLMELDRASSKKKAKKKATTIMQANYDSMPG